MNDEVLCRTASIVPLPLPFASELPDSHSRAFAPIRGSEADQAGAQKQNAGQLHCPACVRTTSFVNNPYLINTNFFTSLRLPLSKR